ncbi:hypothetical protein [Mangrovibacterium sp.]|uniref:hypothetical protein n=1 Tax=Mangrovibacterium sp. TaxID=1961364 RepID=UPI003567BFE1
MIRQTVRHIADIMARLRVNRSTPRKRKHFGEDEEGFIYYNSHLELKFKEGSEADKKRIMQEIKADLKRSKRIEITMLILSILLLVLAFGWFTRNLV